MQDKNASMAVGQEVQEIALWEGSHRILSDDSLSVRLETHPSEWREGCMFEAPCWAVEWDGGVEAALILLGLEDMESLGLLLLEMVRSYRQSLPGANFSPFPICSLQEDQAIVLRDWLNQQYPPDWLGLGLASGDLEVDDQRMPKTTLGLNDGDVAEGMNHE